MKKSIAFARIFFILISMIFMTTYSVTTSPNHALSLYSGLSGILLGLLLGVFLVGIEHSLKNFNIRPFNITALGLFFGYLMGSVLVMIFGQILDITPPVLSSEAISFGKIFLLLLGCYLGLILTLRSGEEIALSIPFIKLQQVRDKKKDILIDTSILADTRIIDLAASGLFDHHLIVASFIVNELQAAAENGDELEKAKARRALDTLKRLECLPNIGLRHEDHDFSDIKDEMGKLVKLGRIVNAHILTADLNKIQVAALEGVQIININTLSNALKPLMQAGESILIKIQRYGKEPKQGVGYLDDGTMVVVNGGGDFIGEMIRAQVLSMKHTSSGRMVFCNAAQENSEPCKSLPLRDKNSSTIAQPVR